MSLWNVYVGCYTEDFLAEIQRQNANANIFWQGQHPGITGTPSLGFERFTFDDATGSLRHAETISGDLVSPQTVMVHPTLPMLYAAEFSHAARLVAFAIGPDGTLERRSTTPSLGEFAYGMTVHPRGHLAYVIHWADGTLAELPLDSGGSPRPAALVAKSEPRNGAEPHQHDVRLTPTANALIVADAGLDELTVYDVDPDGSVVPGPRTRIELPAGSSPRKLAFHPSGRFVYAVGEGDSVLYVVALGDGVPTTVVNTFSIPPLADDGANRPSELRMHPDGHTLYVGARGTHAVGVLSVDDTGGVALRSAHSTLGRLPAAMGIHPAGRYLLVGNRDADSLVVFGIDGDGRLEPVGEPVDCPSPCSIALVQASP